MTEPVHTGKSTRLEMWTAGFIVCAVFAAFGGLVFQAGRLFRPGTDGWTTLTVENTSGERVLVTPMGDRENIHRPAWGRGMLMFEGRAREPTLALKRFEVAAKSTWSIVFDPGISLVEGVVVEGADGRVRMVHVPLPTVIFDKQKVTIADVGAIPEATGEEKAAYAAIPAERALEWRVVDAAALVPVLALPWVGLGWWRARRGR